MNSIVVTDPPAVIPLADDCSVSLDTKAWFTGLFLQVSHRLGAVALLATLATWAMMYGLKDFHIALAVAAGTAEAGLCFALIARLITAANSTARREANGVAIFNLVLFILAIQLMLFARMDVIRSTASQFFTPIAPPQTEKHW